MVGNALSNQGRQFVRLAAPILHHDERSDRQLMLALQPRNAVPLRSQRAAL